MGKFKIEYDRNSCIGAAVCAAVDEKHWEISSDGKADLKGSKEDKDIFVAEIDESELEKTKAAAEGCPANVIHIFNKKTGEKLV
ncbi:MAG: ferredoxin [Candidatus Aenigmatarchaeota archaeon]|nr:ferredoxin [Nanoarchaeota archaeon]